MKKTIPTLLLFLLLYPAITSGQITSSPSTEKLAFDSPGNYNDYIIDQWKKARKAYKKVAEALDEPIKSKTAYIAELKAATKLIVEIKTLIENVNEFKGNDLNFKFNTLNLLKHYQNCFEKIYPEIVERLSKPNPDYTQLQSKLDDTNAKGDNLTKLLVQSQEKFAEFYKFELK